MGFLNPHLLWGLLIVAAPVIIHLLNRRRFEVHPWAAMEFLLQADVKNRRRVRLEDLLLLLLRAGLIAAFVLLVARPVVEGLGGKAESERTVVLDDSFSMEHRAAGPSALERARDAAAFEVQEAIASGIRVSARRGTRPSEEVGGIEDRVRGGSVIGDTGAQAAAPPEKSGATAGKKAQGPGAAAQAGFQLLGALRSLPASDGALRLAEAFDAEASRIEEGRSRDLRSVVLLSDFRRKDWLDPAGKLRPRIAESLERLAQAAPDRVRLRLVNVGDSSRENAAVARVAVEAARAVAGIPAAIAVEVRNFGSEERRGLTGELEIGDPASPTHRIPLPLFPPVPPGGSSTVEVEHVFPAPGEYPLSARIDGDRLARDDRAFAVALVRGALSVAVVDGDPGTDRFGGEAGFLAAALAPRGGLPSGIRADVVAAIPSAEGLRGRDVAILLNCAEISPAERDALEAFVRSGGGLAFFLGSKVRPERYREVLGAGGIFPATLKEQSSSPGGVRIDFGGLEHPALAVYRGLRDSTVDRISAARCFLLEPGPGARVVAAYADAARTPAILERALGEGRAALFNITADRDWSDWPTDPSYPVILQEWARHLAPRRGERRALEVGGTISFRPGGGLEEPSVVDPRGERRPAVLEGGAARFDRTDLAGLYLVLGAEGEPSPAASPAGAPSAAKPESSPAGAPGKSPAAGGAWFAANRALDESDLTPASEGELRAALAGLGIPFSFQGAPDAEGPDPREGDIWRWLALTAGLLLIGELAAAFWFGRR